MELQVRWVPEHSCFSALPHSLLEILSQTGVPEVPLVVDLRGRAKGLGRSLNHGPSQSWHVAWMGAAASSSALEIPAALAERIGLPDGTTVQLRLRRSHEVPLAQIVQLEPAGEDDWEMLELNQAYLEDSILSQVAILSEGQLLPIWVRNQACLTLRVLSASPGPLVRLGAGTELVVAPKERTKSNWNARPKLNSEAPSHRVELDESTESRAFQVAESGPSVWLRVQEVDTSFLHPSISGSGICCRALPACHVFISPGTARKVGFHEGELLTLRGMYDQPLAKNPASFATENSERKSAPAGIADRNSGQEGTRHTASRGVGKGVSGQGPAVGGGTVARDKGQSRVLKSPGSYPGIVRLCVRVGVAAGHVMVEPGLQAQLGLEVCTRVCLRACTSPPSKPPLEVCLSPLASAALPATSGSDQKGPAGGQREEGGGLGDSRTGNGARLLNAIESLQLAEREKENERTDANESQKHPAAKSEPLPAVTWLLHKWAAAQGFMGQGAPVTDGTVMTFRFYDAGNGSRGKAASTSSTIDAVALLPPSSLVQNGFSFELSLCYPEAAAEVRMTSREQPGGQELASARGAAVSPGRRFVLLEELQQALAEGSMRVALGQTKVSQLRAVKSTASGSSARSPAHLVGCRLSSLTWLKAPGQLALSWLRVVLSESARSARKLAGTPVAGSLLLHGESASGRSQLARALAYELRRDANCLAHSVHVSCRQLASEQPADISKAMDTAIAEAVKYSPTLVVLDDLDSLMPASQDGDPGAPSPSTSGTAGLVESLSDLMDSFHQCDMLIAFLAISRSPNALPVALRAAGRIDFHVEVPSPAEAERVAILAQALEERGLSCSPPVLAAVAATCPGYDHSDLRVLVDRAVHAAAARLLGTGPSQDCHVDLDEHDFTSAQNGFVPAAIRGIAKPPGEGTASGGPRGWEDLGGLANIQTALREILELPSKHPRMFANAPLRLRSGVLLYGPPGCGKTHVVGVAAAACGVRSIVVKGPELLNKYIGASEQGVRDVFARASRAAPCILFFDEFDAIAPKRGHDNTGVTDRVVNQLLTELDGVEGLSGVFVIAATSRPDLIDAALLRPGRLDRLLLCDFPTRRERSEILAAMARGLPLGPDVHLATVAEITDGLSGADLQALLSDAQLASIHAHLGVSVGSFELPDDAPKITMAQLNEAALRARPSVSVSERERLGDIYDGFLQSRSKSSGPSQEAKGKRATLA